jgi:hypothetical protein
LRNTHYAQLIASVAVSVPQLSECSHISCVGTSFIRATSVLECWTLSCRVCLRTRIKSGVWSGPCSTAGLHSIVICGTGTGTGPGSRCNYNSYQQSRSFGRWAMA